MRRVTLRKTVEDGPEIEVDLSIGADTSKLVVSVNGQPRTAEIPRVEVERLMELLSSATVRLVPEESFFGLASGYELSLGEWPCRVTYFWLRAPPNGWESLGEIAAALLAVARPYHGFYV